MGPEILVPVLIFSRPIILKARYLFREDSVRPEETFSIRVCLSVCRRVSRSASERCPWTKIVANTAQVELKFDELCQESEFCVLLVYNFFRLSGTVGYLL